MKPEPWRAGIEALGSDKERVLRLTLRQINKDAEAIWVDEASWDASGRKAEHIFEAVIVALGPMQKNRQSAFLACLYRFDIDETHVREAFGLATEEDRAQQFAALLVHRALTKVLFRLHYEA